MAVVAAHTTKFRVRTATGIGADADNMAGADNVALNRMRDELDVTDFGDTARAYILGLKGAEVPVSGKYDAADTAVGRLETAIGDGTSVFAIILWNGTAGHEVECKVTKLDISSNFDGTVSVSATLKATGAVSAV